MRPHPDVDAGLDLHFWRTRADDAGATASE
jgi:hypothetical protein